MTPGVTTSLPRLIELKRHVQKKALHARAKHAKTGHHETRIRGRGMDFAETRHYQAGDEIRHMAWRSTARTGKPHIKLYHEERERPVIFLVDFNASMFFGTQGMFKSVLAAEFTALLAWIANSFKARIGSFVFSGDIHTEHAPRTNHEGVLPLLKTLEKYTEHLEKSHEQQQKPLHLALTSVQRVLKPGSLLILISDFYSLNEQALPLLTRIKQHNDLIAYRIADSIELTLPPPGVYPITNTSGKQSTLLNLKSSAQRALFQEQLSTRDHFIKSCFHRLKAPYHCLTPHTDWIALANQSFPRGGQHG